MKTLNGLLFDETFSLKDLQIMNDGTGRRRDKDYQRRKDAGQILQVEE